jgi:hypothetical protein
MNSCWIIFRVSGPGRGVEIPDPEKETEDEYGKREEAEIDIIESASLDPLQVHLVCAQ